MRIFEERESSARSYCRKWPAVFDRAAGSWLFDESGQPQHTWHAAYLTVNI
jgi:diaminobutyrate-2-oxoglutarate transaminase